MASIPNDSDDFSEVVERLGGAESLRRSAREHRAFLRPRGVRDALDVLRLCLLYASGHSLRMVAALVAQADIADVSDVAVLNRIRRAADWLEALCSQQFNRLHAAHSCATGPDVTCPVRIVDSSLIDAPGGAKWRLHAYFDPVGQRLAAAAFTPAHVGERLDRLSMKAGDIVLADRGYPQPDGLRASIDAGAHPLIRVTWNSVMLTDADGRAVDWTQACRQATAQGGLDRAVWLRKPRGRFEPIAMRLIFIPKSDDAAAYAAEKARRKNRDGSRLRIDPRTLACAHHLILLTTLPADACSPAQAGALYRLRWAVELGFKRMKSLMHMGAMPASDPDLARAWLNANLLCSLLTDDIAHQDDDFPP